VSGSRLAFNVIQPVTSVSAPDFSSVPAGSTECSTSTLLVFRDTGSSKQDHKKLLTCMLNKYEVFGADGRLMPGDHKDENIYPRSDLVKCIEAEPETTGGALCIQVWRDRLCV
jgi:hypothetical protein